MAYELKRLREERAALVKQSRDLLEKAVQEKRGLTVEEKAISDKQEADISDYTDRIGRLERQEEAEKAQIPDRPGDLARGALTFRDIHGREVRALNRGERLSGDLAPGSIGRQIAALVCGRVSELPPEERSGMLSSTDTSGGYLLGSPVSGAVIDLARSASVCIAAGAQTVPITTSELTLARLTGDGAAHWRGEGVAVQSTDLTFGAVTLRPKTLACIIPISVELAADAPNVGQLIEGALQKSMGLALDQAALLGTGAGEQPLGIVNYPGINSVTSVGTPADYDKVREAVGKIITANYAGGVEGLAWINSPRTAEDYDGIEDGDGNPIVLSPWTAKLQRFVTTSIPITLVGGAESVGIIGDFTQLVFGIRQQLMIRILDSGSVTDSSGTTWNAASQLMRLVVAYLRADTCLLQPAHFCKLTGITS